MVAQKDWIIYDLEHGDLLSITIVQGAQPKQHHSGRKTKRKKKRWRKVWYVKRFVNYFDLDHADLQVLLGIEYSKMFESMKNAKQYNYVIGTHNFVFEDMNEQYWSGTLRKSCKDLVQLKLNGIHIPVNKSKLECELHRLISHVDHSGGK